ncbi:Peroxidase 21 [Capsicum annuum]|uniref:peroxidase n=1 Tax=Capsicum annuum TaxID=4072 RepID=A0A2G2YMG4_CAPAN|nr:Peroxidase 21 [Capsicum annuum]
MRNFKYIETIKQALENECPNTVSCADIVLSARDGVVMLGGPHIEMKTGRRGESKESYLAEVDNFIPNHNDSMSLVLSRFKTIGVDAQGTVALLGAHSVGRVHCVNIIHRLYPTVDPTLDPDYATYLKTRCPSPQPSPNVTEFARNDRETPMVWDNLYYKKGLLSVDQQLVSDPITYPFVEKFAASNSYFHAQFGKALIILSENNPLIGDEGEIRKRILDLHASPNNLHFDVEPSPLKGVLIDYNSILRDYSHQGIVYQSKVETNSNMQQLS